MICFIFLGYFILGIVIHQYRQSSGRNISWRISFLQASVAWGVYIVLTTEILSLFKLLTKNWLSIIWILPNIILILLLLKSTPQFISFKWVLHLKKSAIGFFKNPKIVNWFSQLNLRDKVILTWIVVTLIAIGTIGVIAPPNNWDSMTYHMARVEHWAQNNGVSFYPTNITRQLYQNPWTEFAITHLRIMGESDRFASIIQWIALFGCAIAASVLAGFLGAGYSGQLAAAFVAVTIPMAILQGTSTQNDLAASFWIACISTFAFSLIRKWDFINAISFGSALGLGLLTKGTSYVFAAPFVIWIAIIALIKFRRKSLALLGAIAMAVIFINAGYWSRNLNLYGNPFADEKENHRYWNEIINAKTLYSNVLRNAGLHMGTASDEINEKIRSTIELFHKPFGIDVNDPKTTWGNMKFEVPKHYIHEDTSGNPIHLLLICISLFYILLSKRMHNSAIIVTYTGLIIAGYLLFSLVIRWQPWGSRLQLPLFILLSPVISTVIFESTQLKIKSFIVVVLVIFSAPYIFLNQSKPLILWNNILTTDRSTEYFINRPELADSYNKVVDKLYSSTCSEVGLICGEDDWEYPIFALIRERGAKRFRIEHINVTNPSSKFYQMPAYHSFKPCMIIDFRDSNPTIAVQKIN